jgi:hypothetical protein
LRMYFQDGAADDMKLPLQKLSNYGNSGDWYRTTHKFGQLNKNRGETVWKCSTCRHYCGYPDTYFWLPFFSEKLIK